MNKELIDYINKLVGNNWILSGSSALKLTGFIDRPVNDIDIIVFEDLYHDYSINSELLKELRQFNYKVFQTSNSGQFRGPDGRLISSFSVKIPFEIKTLDIFYHYNNKVNYFIYPFPGIDIKIQDIKEILAYKVEALRLNQLYVPNNYQKHIMDLRKISSESKDIKLLLDGLGFA